MLIAGVFVDQIDLPLQSFLVLLQHEVLEEIVLPGQGIAAGRIEGIDETVAIPDDRPAVGGTEALALERQMGMRLEIDLLGILQQDLGERVGHEEVEEALTNGEIFANDRRVVDDVAKLRPVNTTT